jgi:hypothetical protein
MLSSWEKKQNGQSKTATYLIRNSICLQGTWGTSTTLIQSCQEPIGSLCLLEHVIKQSHGGAFCQLEGAFYVKILQFFLTSCWNEPDMKQHNVP